MLASVLLVDKPKNITSFKVVETVKEKVKTKVGHTGTLDPIATGLLILVIGKATRYANLFINLPKVYVAKAKLGEITDTYDAQGKVVEVRQVNVSCEDVKRVVEEFQGDILQKPPPFSAKKIKGKRAYELAREGKQVELKSVKVHIYRALLLDCNIPYFSAEFEVSAGTYIRSLVHEIGLKLGCGAHLAELRRTKIGKFDVSMAVSYERLLQQTDISGLLLPIDEALDFLYKVNVPPYAWNRLKNGTPVNVNLNVDEEMLVRLYVEGTFVGVGKISKGVLQPYRLMQEEA